MNQQPAETETEERGPVISVRMTNELLAKIDEARGNDTRSAYIRKAIERLTKRRLRA